jgi:serine/threonine protein phosphatase 1
VRRLFARAAPARPPRTPTTGGALVYAIGDIHGRLDLLEALLAAIREDAGTRAAEGRPVVVFIGDYVDRGPDSRGVVEAILALADEGAFEVRALKGNHEEQLLTFLNDPRAGAPWLEFGGAETLLSYGVIPPAGRTDADGWEAARQAFRSALPAAHLKFLEGLELAVICGDYVFVHAGVRPGVPLSEQSERDILWIRDDFLSSDRSIEKVVVHGHTPEPTPHIGRNRIGIDTGAYATNTLTAVRLMGAEQSILQAGRGVR